MTAPTRDMIRAVLGSIRPALSAEGGDLESWFRYETDGVVQLRLLGACEFCPILHFLTLKEGIGAIGSQGRCRR